MVPARRSLLSSTGGMISVGGGWRVELPALFCAPYFAFVRKPRMIYDNATLLATPHIQHHLKTFLWIKYQFLLCILLCVYILCLFIFIFTIVGMVGECSHHGRSFSCSSMYCPVNFVLKDAKRP